MPLQLFHSNLTYAVLCTITGFEALIKGMRSNRARKQQQKQRSKRFCSNPSLMFTPSSSGPLRLLTQSILLLISFLFHTPLLYPANSLHHYIPHHLKKQIVSFQGMSSIWCEWQTLPGGHYCYRIHVISSLIL